MSTSLEHELSEVLRQQLQKLIDDHVAVKLAMETMHSLRDECGLSDDAQVIEEFEATEEANYTECKMVNTLLREEAMLVKEKSVEKVEAPLRCA